MPNLSHGRNWCKNILVNHNCTGHHVGCNVTSCYLNHIHLGHAWIQINIINDDLYQTTNTKMVYNSYYLSPASTVYIKIEASQRYYKFLMSHEYINS